MSSVLVHPTQSCNANPNIIKNSCHAVAACRRVRGKARTRLRYLKWVNGQDNWLQDEVPKLADFDKRQFPDQNIRWVCCTFCGTFEGSLGRVRVLTLLPSWLWTHGHCILNTRVNITVKKTCFVCCVTSKIWTYYVKFELGSPRQHKNSWRAFLVHI